MRSDDNTYNLVPDYPIPEGSLQVSDNLAAGLVPFNPRLDDIADTLTDTLPNSNNLTSSVNVNSNFDMAGTFGVRGSVVANLNTSPVATDPSSAINQTDTIYSPQIVNVSSIVNNNINLSGKTLYLKNDNNSNSLPTLNLTTNKFTGMTLTVVSEVTINSLSISTINVNFTVYANISVTFLLMSVNAQDMYVPINTAIINGFATNPTQSNNLESSVATVTGADYLITNNCSIPILYYQSLGSSNNIVNVTVATDNAVLLLPNMLLSMQNNAGTTFYYRINAVSQTSDTVWTLTLDYDFDSSLQDATITIGIIGWSFDFNPTNLLSFAIKTNLDFTSNTNMQLMRLTGNDLNSRNPITLNNTIYKFPDTLGQINYNGDAIVLPTPANKQITISYVDTNTVSPSQYVGSINTDGSLGFISGNLNIAVSPTRLEIYFTIPQSGTNPASNSGIYRDSNFVNFINSQVKNLTASSTSPLYFSLVYQYAV